MVYRRSDVLTGVLSCICVLGMLYLIPYMARSGWLAAGRGHREALVDLQHSVHVVPGVVGPAVVPIDRGIGAAGLGGHVPGFIPRSPDMSTDR